MGAPARYGQLQQARSLDAGGAGKDGGESFAKVTVEMTIKIWRMGFGQKKYTWGDKRDKMRERESERERERDRETEREREGETVRGRET